MGRGYSSSGRARDLQPGGPGFESPTPQVKPRKWSLDMTFVVARMINSKICNFFVYNDMSVFNQNTAPNHKNYLLHN